MLFNHDLYKPHTDLTHFDKYVNYPDIRDDIPITFLPVNEYKRLVLIKATSSDPGLNGLSFNNSRGTITKTYSDSVSYTMVYHYKDGGRSWDNYDAWISSSTEPIDITGYDNLVIRGVSYTNNSSLDYSILVSLTSELPPERVSGTNYDFTGWTEIVTGDHTVASTSIQNNFDVSVPISDITDLTGPLYFNYAVRHNENISAYSIYTGIKDLILSTDFAY